MNVKVGVFMKLQQKTSESCITLWQKFFSFYGPLCSQLKSQMEMFNKTCVRLHNRTVFLHFTPSCIRATGGVLLAQPTIISWFLLGGKDSERLLIIFQPEGHFFLKWLLIWSLSCSSQIYMNLFHCDTWLRTRLRLLLY